MVALLVVKSRLLMFLLFRAITISRVGAVHLLVFVSVVDRSIDRPTTLRHANEVRVGVVFLSLLPLRSALRVVYFRTPVDISTVRLQMSFPSRYHFLNNSLSVVG